MMAQVRQMAIHGVKSHENSQQHIYSCAIKVEKPNDYEPSLWHGSRGKAAGKGGGAAVAATDGEKQRWTALAKTIFPSAACKNRLNSSYSIANDLWLVLDSDEDTMAAASALKAAGRSGNLKGLPACGSTLVKRSIGEMLKGAGMFIRNEIDAGHVARTT